MTSHLTPTLSQGSTQTPSESPEAGTTLDEAPVVDAAGGRRLGRYVVLRRLGEGGMGVVYSAYDELLARRVALKLVRTDASGSAAHARILREAQALARLSHPHVVQVYEVSAAAGQVFLAMEQVEGDTLRAWTAARRAAGVTLRELLDMYIQAGRGLAAAHAAGLVHRDFKPKQSRLPPKAPHSAKRRGSPQIGAFEREAVCPGVVRSGQDGPNLAQN